MTLHPDRHRAAASVSKNNNGGEDGSNISDKKTEEFKQVSEAYGILRDRSLRFQYDKWLGNGGSGGGTTSRAAERNPFYRKVYSPAAPPGMKTFDRQRHYGESVIILFYWILHMSSLT